MSAGAGVRSASVHEPARPARTASTASGGTSRRGVVQEVPLHVAARVAHEHVEQVGH